MDCDRCLGVKLLGMACPRCGRSARQIMLSAGPRTGRKAFGPNMRRLIIQKMSIDAIPANSVEGGLMAGIRFITETLADDEKRKAAVTAAESWAREAVQTVRLAADPNPWRNAPEEDIAAEIMKRVDERKQTQQKERQL